jgi:hypothetical protein
MPILLFSALAGNAELPTSDVTPPTELVVYRYGAKYVELAWIPAIRSTNYGIKSYKLYINGEWDGVPIYPKYASSTMSSDKLTLTPGTTYQFYVTAVDTGDSETGPTNTVTITTARNVDVGKFKRRRYSVV